MKQKRVVFPKKGEKMKKCLKITFAADVPEGFLQSSVQKHARKFSIEGTAQIITADNLVKVIVCGEKESVDTFLDNLHKDFSKANINDYEIEPFLKDKDYRGVFRIIE